MIDNTLPHAVLISIDSMPGLQAARILAAKKIPVIAIAKDKNHHSCRTNVCEEIVITDTESEKLIEKLQELGPKFQKKAILFPCQDTDVLLVSRNRSKLSSWYEIALPEENIVEMLMDKMKFYSFAEANSFPVPKTLIINNSRDLDGVKSELNFPVLLKPTIRTPEWIANSSIKAFKIEDFEHLVSVYEKHRNWTESFVVQQWLEGDDTTLYSCNCYFDKNSKPHAAFIARKLRQWPPRTGQSCLGEECRNDEVLNVSLEVFKKVNFFGLGYLEMKFDQRTRKHYI
ncbi:MAG: carboxylate--amine ligase, partial [Calditrichaeota bacterium]|nr:carboxylate--amine ligase [Calditrichota bacterium]